MKKNLCAALALSLPGHIASTTPTATPLTTPNYASAKATSQQLMLSVTTPIKFSKSIADPSGIKHPAAGSDATFKVPNTGVYLISWTINVSWSDTSKNLISIDLFNVSKDRSLFNSLQTLNGAPCPNNTRSEVISGQILVPLKANNKIQLQASPSNVVTTIIGGVFNIVQIA